MNKAQKLLLLSLTYYAAGFFSAPISCADENGGPARKNPKIVPKCTIIQEPNMDFFDMIETVEGKIHDSLRILCSYERRIQYARHDKAAVTNLVDAYQPFDYVAYLNGRRQVLEELREMMKKARFEASKMADFETPLSKDQHNLRSKNDTCKQNAKMNCQ